MILKIKNRQIHEIHDDEVVEVGFRFMFYNTSTQIVNFSSLVKAEMCFMYRNKSVHTINLPSLEKAEGLFMYFHPNRKKIKQKLNL